ncbi:hypothetical protein F5884DRAFT_668729 [Xylogone sp. PMI_703]|nr:hypothetical protein F5884DRAFT_668729 [Xylogone sp. PMI_703]
MRSSGALRLLCSGPRTRRFPGRSIIRNPSFVLRNGYCSVCDNATTTTTASASAPPAKSANAATATTTPLPTPAADHRQLGIEQELFTTSIYSPGSPLFLPNGARLFNKLTNFLRTQYRVFGFDEVITPTIYKKSLWEKSGHWENYAEDMYSVVGRGAEGKTEGKQVGEDEEYGLKPMNCPGHCLLFASQRRSYRDLPIRFADFSPLHRNEISGALSGLTRVRRFHQDDGHIFCRPSQIREEISRSLEFVRMVYQVLGLGPYRLALSTRPKDHYIGTLEEWDNAEAALRQSLDESGQPWTLNEGDGAFYGPKIDIVLKDSDGKEHQTATIQLDFQLPKRFELEYQAPAPELEQKGLTTTDATLLAEEGPVRPVMVHRAILGSVERLLALLIEHYNNRWPFWLSPRQAILLTVSDKQDIVDYANQVLNTITGTISSNFIHGLPWALPSFHPSYAIDIDAKPRSLKRKVLDATMKNYSVVMVVGQKNVEKGTVNVNLSKVLDRHGWLRTDERVRRAVERRSHLKRPPPPSSSPSPSDADTAATTSAATTANSNDSNKVVASTEDLQDVEMTPRELEGLFFDMERHYV